jgi:hypothetical protein
MMITKTFSRLRIDGDNLAIFINSKFSKINSQQLSGYVLDRLLAITKSSPRINATNAIAFGAPPKAIALLGAVFGRVVSWLASSIASL